MATTKKHAEDGVGWVLEWKKTPAKGRPFWKPLDCGIFDSKERAENACAMRGADRPEEEFRVRKYVRAGR